MDLEIPEHERPPPPLFFPLSTVCTVELGALRVRRCVRAERSDIEREGERAAAGCHRSERERKRRAFFGYITSEAEGDGVKEIFGLRQSESDTGNSTSLSFLQKLAAPSFLPPSVLSHVQLERPLSFERTFYEALSIYNRRKKKVPIVCYFVTTFFFR